MPLGAPREIPFNYTSADDQQVVTLLLGSEAWDILERLRGQRVTGRSARLLMRFLGEAFLLRRNPFLFQEFVEDAVRRRRFVNACVHDLDLVDTNRAGNSDVHEVVNRCRDLLRQLITEVVGAPARQARVTAALGAVVGPAHVHSDPFTVISHATDATDWRLHLPVAVAFPDEEHQVAPLLQAVQHLGLKAIPRGAGTGLTGGAVPVHPNCVVVNTERLNRIRAIGREELGSGRTGWVMEAEAGVITEAAIHAAAQRGLVFATDPTSAWACTLGGNLAENAGGKTAVLWGTAIDNVLRWTLALPDGRRCVVRRLDHPLRKIQPEDVVRFEVGVDGDPPRQIELRGDQVRKRGLWKDITNKVLGGLPGLQKEGTDGVITSCAFVLHAAYPHKATACIEFFGPDMQEASRVILALSQAFRDRGEETLQALEHFDEEYVAAIGYKVKAPREGRPKAVLLLDLVGRDRSHVRRGLDRLQMLLAPFPDSELFVAADAAEAESFWAERKKLGAIAKRTNAFKLNEDVVLPLDRLADFAAFIDDLNVAEERHNHATTIGRLQSWARAVRPAGDEAWVAAKGPAVDRLCIHARRAVEAADRETLREGRILKDLLASLEELFTGVPGLAAAAQALYAEERGRVIVIATHMHAGDGNVHVNIPVFSNDRIMLARAAKTAETAMRQAVALGGVVSGEHGIGITKIAHLEPEQVTALKSYRAAIDPNGLMNPGKLEDRRVLDQVFTPSFNLLNLEARILQHDQLEVLSKKIQTCVRCGKCKPDCCVFFPARSLFYHPRNKNLAIGSIIEALLYDTQRSHGVRFDMLRHLEEVADHCTICHKCLKPCPVEIDTGEVSLLERQILKARDHKRTSLATGLSLSYLNSRSRPYQKAFRACVLGLGVRAQRFGAQAVGLLPAEAPARQVWPLNLLGRPLPLTCRDTLPDALPVCGERQALVVSPATPTDKAAFYFPGCGSERLNGEVGEAALYVLLKAGATVVLPPPALCCGFPFEANARIADRKRIELRNAIVFTQIKEMLSYLSFAVVAFSCGTCMEALDHIGAGVIFGAPVEDAAAWAVAQGFVVPPLGEALYHQPCHDSLKGRGLSVLRQAGAQVRHVPACCGEAGTLALSRPDIAAKLFDRKEQVLTAALSERPASAGQTTLLTNCPACLQGLGRQACRGLKVQHLAVRLAEATSPDWKTELRSHVAGAEVVTF